MSIRKKGAVFILSVMLGFFIAIALILQSSACHGFAVEPKIIDGVVSNREEFPFFVNVIAETAEQLFRCGGAILNERYEPF